MATKDDYQEFKLALNELKSNSKPTINILTALAEEKIASASKIVRAVEERIVEAKGDHVLPALYVLDSIVKNLRSTVYVQLFESRLPVLFAHAFEKVDERTRSAMYKLRQTWPLFFTNLTLYNVDTRAHDIDSAWPITAQVPDPPPFAPIVQGASSEQSTVTDEVRMPVLLYHMDSDDSSTFRTRTVHQPPVSLAPPKLSDLTSRADTYRMIPIERMEQIRQETAHVLDLGVDGEQQSKIRKLSAKKKKSNKKRRPSARLRRKVTALTQALQQNQRGNSSDEQTDDELDLVNNGQADEDEDDDDDDEPFIIKQSIAVKNATSTKSIVSAADSTSENTEQNTDNLFGGTDKDYREPEKNTQKTTDEDIVLDADSIFEINSKCLSLAEQKLKSKELSPEQYQATLKLLQSILESGVKRLTVQQKNVIPSGDTVNLSTPNNSLPTVITPNLPFQQQILQFIEQHSLQTHFAPSSTTVSTPSFSFPGLGNDAYSNVMQILNAVGAPASYISHYNFFSYLPPLPPAPPPLSLVTNAFPVGQQLSVDPNIFPVNQTSSVKRIYDEADTNVSSSNTNAGEENKRSRYDPVTGRAIRPRNLDEENIALVPSLIDANITMLKKRYVGVAQQLYIGKCQCRLCGLRFREKQKQDYTRHLDWHYLENKQEKDRVNNGPSIVAQRTRLWYPSVQEWTIYEENIEEQLRTAKSVSATAQPKIDLTSLVQEGENIVSADGTISCPASTNTDIDNDRCFVCHDPFENFFDDDRDMWHLKDAMRVDGKTYHPVCYQDLIAL